MALPLYVYMCHENEWCTVTLNYLFILASSEILPEQELLQTLLRDYNTNVRPVLDPSASVEVAIGVAMKQIVDSVSLPRTLNFHDGSLNISTKVTRPSPVSLSLFCDTCSCNSSSYYILHTYTSYHAILKTRPHDIGGLLSV